MNCYTYSALFISVLHWLTHALYWTWRTEQTLDLLTTGSYRHSALIGQLFVLLRLTGVSVWFLECLYVLNTCLKVLTSEYLVDHVDPNQLIADLGLWLPDFDPTDSVGDNSLSWYIFTITQLFMSIISVAFTSKMNLSLRNKRAGFNRPLRQLGALECKSKLWMLVQ